MGILAKIESDLISAQKEKDEVRVSVLRFLLSKIRDTKIQKGKDNFLSDSEIESEISKEVKRHVESIEAFSKAGRVDLVEKEKAELAILENYLPEKLSEDEISKIVEDVISQTRVTNLNDFGKIMGKVMPKVAGKAEGATVAQIVKDRLSR